MSHRSPPPYLELEQGLWRSRQHPLSPRIHRPCPGLTHSRVHSWWRTMMCFAQLIAGTAVRGRKARGAARGARWRLHVRTYPSPKLLGARVALPSREERSRGVPGSQLPSLHSLPARRRHRRAADQDWVDFTSLSVPARIPLLAAVSASSSSAWRTTPRGETTCTAPSLSCFLAFPDVSCAGREEQLIGSDHRHSRIHTHLSRSISTRFLPCPVRLTVSPRRANRANVPYQIEREHCVQGIQAEQKGNQDAECRHCQGPNEWKAGPFGPRSGTPAQEVSSDCESRRVGEASCRFV